MKNALSYIKANRHIRYCIFFAMILLPAFAGAQTRGKVEVIKDPLIDTLAARRASLSVNKGGYGGAETAAGYRVQIFFGSSRQAAYNAQAKLNEEYPELRTYISYTEPNFKVRAGDFRTRLEAQKLAEEVRSMFTSIFIIPERINLPKNDQPND